MASPRTQKLPELLPMLLAGELAAYGHDMPLAPMIDRPMDMRRAATAAIFVFERPSDS